VAKSVPQRVVYDGSSVSLKTVLEVNRNGGDVLCPKCGTPLLIAVSMVEARSKGIHPGIFCPQDETHVHTTFYTNEHASFWEEFDKELDTIEVDGSDEDD